jgi:hypothetical protein
MNSRILHNIGHKSFVEVKEIKVNDLVFMLMLVSPLNNEEKTKCITSEQLARFDPNQVLNAVLLLLHWLYDLTLWSKARQKLSCF